MKKITIIGPLPEPKGGVSIHIIRLGKLVSKQFDIQFIDESFIIKDEYFNIRSKNLFRYLRMLWNTDIVHIHSGVTLLRIIHLITGRLARNKIVVTLHAFEPRSAFEEWLNKIFLKLAHQIIVVSSEIQSRIALNSTVLKPAFLPPDTEDEPALPTNISNWLANAKQRGDFLIGANAFRIDFHNGNDLYGIDMCIELMKALVHDHDMSVSLIFVLASLSKSEQSFNRYQQLIQDWHLEKNVLLTSEDTSFVRLIKELDLVVRPTCTDGDALTIREALYLDKPVIASDVVGRPENTIVFRNRDANDFKEKALAAISNNSSTTGAQVSRKSYQNFYLELYTQLH